MAMERPSVREVRTKTRRPQGQGDLVLAALELDTVGRPQGAGPLREQGRHRVRDDVVAHEEVGPLADAHDHGPQRAGERTAERGHQEAQRTDETHPRERAK
jgi:hypothetical protein